jgi:hypothetical protein
MTVILRSGAPEMLMETLLLFEDRGFLLASPY